ncbi:LacI family DNA-binding transcriptional regulator [Kribbella solani]|uniref:LacI family transcriptional regulator n=1 Tax=Kribbella solani TaxID=236067 RepID=A0A841E4H7_9ACTN|nr:LacI family DNA-binding transcriptional regulator [Kribbella solani]MBB5982248.1 LacI family transcriptional regulator [Kribbella solani]
MSGTGRRPTLKDIAAETGLSMAAVSYALRGLHGTPETRQRVQDAADRLGYQADPVARALASGRSGSVGVLCASLEDLWQQRVAAALGRELLAPDRNAWIIDSAGDADRQLELAQHLVDHRADAIVVIPIDPAAKGWAEIAEQAPVIAIGDALPGAKAKSEVVLDNETGVTTALRRLTTAGHHDLAILIPTRRLAAGQGDLAAPTSTHRLDVEQSDAVQPRPVAWRPAEELAQRVAGELGLRLQLLQCPHDLAGATEVARTLLTGPSRPTGILALADSMAFGVYAAARELGLRIPDDLSLLGYDDQPMSQLLTPPLSTFHWPLDALVSHVVARVTSAVDTNRRVRRTTLTPTLIERGSVAAPPTH